MLNPVAQDIVDKAVGRNTHESGCHLPEVADYRGHPDAPDDSRFPLFPK